MEEGEKDRKAPSPPVIENNMSGCSMPYNNGKNNCSILRLDFVNVMMLPEIWA